MNTEISEDDFTSLSVTECIEKLTEIKRDLVRLAMEAVSVESQIEGIDSAMADDEHTDGKDLMALYASIGVVLPEVVGKTFEEVKAFHGSITANRRVHLADSLAKLCRRREKIAADIERLEDQRIRLREAWQD